MCFGIPMQITTVDGLNATCKTRDGRTEDVTLALTGALPVGCHVLVYLGSAVRDLDETEARQIADAIDAVAAAGDGEPFDHLLQDLIDREPELPAHLRPRSDHRETKHEPPVAGVTPQN